MSVARGFFIIVFLLFAALALDAGTARAADQSSGYSHRAPVLAASCRICPWGALADIVREAMVKDHWDVQVCYTCAGAARDARNVENKAPAPAYDPSGLATNYGFPTSELAYLEPPPPKGPMDFGITSTNFLLWAYQGSHDYAGEAPYKDLRLVAMVDAPMYVVVAVTAKSGLTDLTAAKGKPIHVLWDLGGLTTAAPEILAYYGLTKESILAAGGSVESGRTIQSRHDFDVVIYQGDLSEAPEFNIWYQLSQQETLNFLRLPDALLTQLSRHFDMVKMTMPAGFLRGVWEPIPTVGFLGNAVFGRTDMPDQFAYDLAKAIDERKDLLATAYEHFSYDPAQVWRAYNVPLAPGAERYYREKGYITSAETTAVARPKYLNMAAAGSYMMPNNKAEIAVARSAAPAKISRNATVLVMGSRGYSTAVKGTNGFVCLVERSWMSPFDSPDFWNPHIRGPICYNPPAVRTILPYTINRTKLVLAGVSKAQMHERIAAAVKNKLLPVPASGAMSYMMSKAGYLSDGAKNWHPHLMFHIRTTDAASWGANVDGSPIVYNSQYQDMPEPETIFMIPVERWSDGTVAPPAMDGM